MVPGAATIYERFRDREELLQSVGREVDLDLLGPDADAARVRAIAAYKDFLRLWKDADPDIPVLKEAILEYAKLQ